MRHQLEPAGRYRTHRVDACQRRRHRRARHRDTAHLRPGLDGTLPGNEVIVQSSGSGRVTYARAMGPMQFLPGTWARYASDGDGDGVADPQNLYDATLAAARYLCTGGLNLRDQSQVMAAILRYNNSMPYAQNVLGWAAAYATGVIPVDLPPITGPPPPLGDVHLESPEGIGPNLPLNIHGLSPSDQLAQMPLIDLSGNPSSSQQYPWQQIGSGSRPSCTVICIGQDTVGPRQPALNTPPPEVPAFAAPGGAPAPPPAAAWLLPPPAAACSYRLRRLHRSYRLRRRLPLRLRPRRRSSSQRLPAARRRRLLGGARPPAGQPTGPPPGPAPAN